MKNILTYQSIFIAVLSAFLIHGCTPKVTQSAQTEDISDPSSEEWRARAPEAGPAPAFNLGEYEEVALENGLKVIIVENHKLPVVSYQLFVDKGLVLEGDKTGVASIAGQMLRTGTRTKTKAEIDEEIDFIAASLNTNSSGLFASSLKKHSEELLDIVTDVLYNPSFPESEFDRIVQTTKSGLAFQKSDPNSISSNVGNALLYGLDHPYGEFTTEESVESITLDDVKEYYNNYYFPNETYLIIVGDITRDEAEAQARKYFGNWEPKPDFEKYTPPAVPELPGNTVRFVNRSGAVQSVVSVAQPVQFLPTAEDRMAASVMNTILGGYFGSRLNKNIREDKGYTYGVGSRLSPDRYVSEFSISASVRNEVTDSTITEIMHEISQLRNEEIPESELELVKNVLTGQFARGLEDPRTIAQYALNIARYDLPKDYYKTYLERLNQVTTAEIKTAANKYIDPERLQIFVVGNEREVAGSLTKFAHNNSIEFYDIYAKPVVKDESDDDEVSAEEIIGQYLEAIGGKEKVEQIRSYILVTNAETPMGDISTSVKSKNNDQLHMKVESSGMVVQEIIFNGEKAQIGGVQGSQTIDDPNEFDRFRNMAVFAEELEYLTSDFYEIQYEGKESVDDTPAYVISVVQADGTTKSVYYDVATGLKLQEVINVEANGQEVSTTQKFGSYQAVEGIQVPMELKMSGGGMPFEMVTKVSQVEINPDIPDEEFVID